VYYPYFFKKLIMDTVIMCSATLRGPFTPLITTTLPDVAARTDYLKIVEKSLKKKKPREKKRKEFTL
jgi:hypothetical protein